MYKKPEKGITDQEYETTDKDMAKLLAILQNVPEAEIPERFEQRFRDALKIEGDKIREEKRIAAAEKNAGGTEGI